MNPYEDKRENGLNSAQDTRIEERDEFSSMLGRFRDSLHSAAERPEAFWTRQRSGIRERLRQPHSAAGRRPALVWVSAAIILLICLTLLPERSKIPAVSFAAGYDQDLLLEVERALNKRYPEALAPARLLSQEIEKTEKHIEKTSLRE